MKITTALSPEQIKQRIENNIEPEMIEIKLNKWVKNKTRSIVGEVIEWTHGGYRVVLHHGNSLGLAPIGKQVSDIERQAGGSVIWIRFSFVEIVFSSFVYAIILMIFAPLVFFFVGEFRNFLFVWMFAIFIPPLFYYWGYRNKKSLESFLENLIGPGDLFKGR